MTEPYYNVPIELSRQQAKYHEAAHAVAAYVLFKEYLLSISISMFQDHGNFLENAHVHYEVKIIEDDFLMDCGFYFNQRHPIVTLAGLAIDRILWNVPLQRCAGLDDYKLAKCYGKIVEAYQEARSIIKKYLKEICSLAQMLTVGKIMGDSELRPWLDEVIK